MPIVPRVEKSWWPGLVALVAANAVPLLGVVALGWDLGLVFLLYWAESAVILAFSLVKVAIAARLAALFLVPFFIVHAGLFMLGHLLFLTVFFVDTPGAGWRAWAGELALGAGVLFASHLVSFLVNTVGRGERPKAANAVMAGFYARIMVMHLTIIFGGFLAAFLGSPAWALALLILLKTTADAAAHLRERAKAAPQPLDPLAQRDLEHARADADLRA